MSKAIIETARTFYRQNFKAGLDVDRFRWYMIALFGLLGMAAGCAAGAYIDKRADAEGWWAKRIGDGITDTEPVGSLSHSQELNIHFDPVSSRVFLDYRRDESCFLDDLGKALDSVFGSQQAELEVVDLELRRA